jgi:hypothetical protein
MAHPPVLPSAIRNDVGTLVAIISQLNALPACAPVNASMVALRLATHDSGSGWFATPFLYDSFIHKLHAGLSRRTPRTSITYTAGLNFVITFQSCCRTSLHYYPQRIAKM